MWLLKHKGKKKNKLVHHANHVLLIEFVDSTIESEKTSLLPNPSDSGPIVRYESTQFLPIRIILFFLSFHLLPLTSSAPWITPAITAKLSISFLWGCRHPLRSIWACRRYHLETWTHTQTLTHIYMQRGRYSSMVFLGCLWDAVKRLGVNFYSGYPTNKQTDC